jgi:hypothetical protein
LSAQRASQHLMAITNSEQRNLPLAAFMNQVAKLFIHRIVIPRVAGRAADDDAIHSGTDGIQDIVLGIDNGLRNVWKVIHPAMKPIADIAARIVLRASVRPRYSVDQKHLFEFHFWFLADDHGREIFTNGAAKSSENKSELRTFKAAGIVSWLEGEKAGGARPDQRTGAVACASVHLRSRLLGAAGKLP